MPTLACPSCGAPVNLQSALSVFAVCAYCHSTLLRTDLSLELFGKMAILKEDPTALQLGTTGTLEKQKFEIIGRVRKQWEKGFWNEWYLQFSDNTQGWLAEAQGFYGICMEMTGCQTPINPSEISVNSALQIDNDTFVVDDIKTNWVSYCEGELPFKSQYNKSSTTIDLTTDTKGFGSIEYDSGEIRVFKGKYIEFDDLDLKNIRTFDGW